MEVGALLSLGSLTVWGTRMQSTADWANGQTGSCKTDWDRKSSLVPCHLMHFQTIVFLSCFLGLEADGNEQQAKKTTRTIHKLGTTTCLMSHGTPTCSFRIKLLLPRSPIPRKKH